jgi:death-on-curing protein
VSRPTEHLDLDDLLFLAGELLGEPPPVRDVGLLEAAVARPRATAFGREAYPDIWTKAAALLQSVVGNHALVDGNKRLGWTATAVFLELNGVRTVDASNHDVYELVIGVAEAPNAPLEDLAARLRAVVGG